MAGDSSVPDRQGDAPRRPTRLLVATAIGCVAALYAKAMSYRIPGFRGDLEQALFGARMMWAHRDPYPLVGPGRTFDLPWRLLYPAPSFVLVSPVAWLPDADARTVFVGVSVGLLAYVATRRSYRWLLLFASDAMLTACRTAQWAPLLTGAVFTPFLAPVLAAKPNIGLAVAAGFRSDRYWRWAAAGGAALLLVSFILLPGWFPAWRAMTAEGTGYMRPPVLETGGIFVLLAALRWRRPEARLLLAMALVPHTPSVYDLLPLLTVAGSGVELALLVALTHALRWLLPVPPPGTGVGAAADFAAWARIVSRWSIPTLYLPALAMVMRRPNEGYVPTWRTLRRRRGDGDVTAAASATGS